MTLLRGILKNTAFLSGANMTARGCGFLYWAFLARAIGAAGLGHYMYALTVVGIFMLLPGFGFDTRLTREAATDRDGAPRLIGNVFTVKAVLCIVTGILLALFIAWKGYDREKTLVIFLLFTSAVASSARVTLYSALRAFERMDLESILTVGAGLFRSALGIGAILAGANIVVIVGVLAVADTLVFFVSLRSTRRNVVTVQFGRAVHVAVDLVKKSLPFGVLASMTIVFHSTDYLMIEGVQSELEVGLYGAADRIMTLVFFIPAQFMTVVYPVFSRLHASSRATLNTAYTKSFTYLLVLSLPISVGGMMVAEDLIPLVFGGEFQPSILVFQVLVWSAFFDFVGYVNGPALLAAGRERVFAVSWSLFIISNFFLDYLFIKRYGYIGACYVTLILKGGMFLLYSVMCHRRLNVRPAWGQIQKAVVATVVMSFVIWAVRHVSTSVFVLAPAGVAAFVAAAIALKVMPPDDWKALRGTIKR